MRIIGMLHSCGWLPIAIIRICRAEYASAVNVGWPYAPRAHAAPEINADLATSV